MEPYCSAVKGQLENREREWCVKRLSMGRIKDPMGSFFIPLEMASYDDVKISHEMGGLRNSYLPNRD